MKALVFTDSISAAKYLNTIKKGMTSDEFRHNNTFVGEECGNLSGYFNVCFKQAGKEFHIVAEFSEKVRVPFQSFLFTRTFYREEIRYFYKRIIDIHPKT